MARKIKFLKKVCFINDDYYQYREDLSPYIFIDKIDWDDRIQQWDIFGIDVYGREFKTRQNRYWIYDKLEIVERDMSKDFIQGVFSGK